ncbi:Procollagen-lysine [Acropora cervicornis]|uniref:procollagen-lysine 5-dioxygenase n=1 Tax=Acropora cervicornis TaxID=6130 RepID=A0AAD9USD2_ACRCE|nr:Procollagen-lysine [Acropora cervicornis]
MLRSVGFIFVASSVVLFADICTTQGLRGVGPAEEIKIGLKAPQLRLLALTVATEETDGYKRFMKSAKANNIDVKVLGMGEEWRGGDVKRYPGGGHKINILKKETELHKNESDLLLMFVDSYDVILLGHPELFITKFLEFEANLVFSAEDFCWPDKLLKNKYPEVSYGKKFLCSGGSTDICDDLKLKLDNKAEIFMNLNGAQDEVDVKLSNDKAWLVNDQYGTEPLVAHGNGASKEFLNYLGNYLPNQWNFKDGCVTCTDDTFSLDSLKEQEYPKILMGVPYHTPQITDWLTDEIKKQFNSVTVLQPEDNLAEYQARNQAIKMCQDKKCDYFFVVDGTVVLKNKDTLKILIKQNKPILAPIMTKEGKLWSNFWGATGEDGYYARSRDYLAIVQRERRGVWNVPFISSIYLVQKQALSKLNGAYGPDSLDPDMAMCKNLREQGIFMYATNLYIFGRLLETDNYKTDMLHNDLWEIFDNKVDWEEKKWNTLVNGQVGGMRINEYIVPVNNRVYPGYHSEARSIMNFVVKYDPNRQYYLRPHHDSSTYTINVALTRPGIDHGGGGCRFIRYNCQVTDTRIGWSFMHPGRLTHYHEGLPVTWGKRYIMISFIDP